MWKQRYRSEFKLDEPNLLVTAVQSFPNMYDTLEKVKEYYGIEKLQADPKLLEITAMVELDGGRNFIPLYFEDQRPELLEYHKVHKFTEKGWFWCIGYRTPCYTPRFSKDREIIGGSINYPDHQGWRELLDYSLSTLDGKYSEFLFLNSVKYWVYGMTKDWNDRDKSRRFYHIENVSLECLSPRNYEDKIKKQDYISFIDNMYRRDIYEFMFHEFKTRTS